MAWWFGRRAWLVAAGTTVGAACTVLVACLPDLRLFGSDAGDAGGETGGGPEGGPPSPLCGNGFIDDDAGEKCDPGDAGAIGCTAACAVDCPDGGFVDKATNHCYFVEPSGVPPSADQASHACADKNAAHLVTYVSDDEYNAVVNQNPWYTPGPHWIGLHFLQFDEAGTPEYQALYFREEPGWAPMSECSGCYAFNRHPSDTSFPKGPADNDAGPVCLTGVKDPMVSWTGTACLPSANVRTVCEREPPGSRAAPCPADAGMTGDWCITVTKTFASEGKRYVYHPMATDGRDAELYCQGLGQKAKLVVLETREEREQLLHELNRLPNGLSPTSFWIGLASRLLPDGGIEPWTWDDGILDDGTTYPFVWGDQEPATAPRRAQISVNLSNYDTQLAHADLSGMAPSVCQL